MLFQKGFHLYMPVDNISVFIFRDRIRGLSWCCGKWVKCLVCRSRNLWDFFYPPHTHRAGSPSLSLGVCAWFLLSLQPVARPVVTCPWSWEQCDAAPVKPLSRKMDRAGVQLIGDHVKHIPVGNAATAELSAVGFQRDDVDINILSPAKVPVSYR